MVMGDRIKMGAEAPKKEAKARVAATDGAAASRAAKSLSPAAVEGTSDRRGAAGDDS